MKQQNQYMKDRLNKVAYKEARELIGMNTIGSLFLQQNKISIGGF